MNRLKVLTLYPFYKGEETRQSTGLQISIVLLLLHIYVLNNFHPSKNIFIIYSLKDDRKIRVREYRTHGSQRWELGAGHSSKNSHHQSSNLRQIIAPINNPLSSVSADASSQPAQFQSSHGYFDRFHIIDYTVRHSLDLE